MRDYHGRYVKGHTLTKTVPVLERFWAKVRKTDTCWEWTAQRNWGYGRFALTHRKMVRAHRFSYELHKGPIPQGLVIDHLCRNKACVNPDHLELVTNRENVLRGVGTSAVNAKKTHCKRGHHLSGDNLYVNPRDGSRHCRSCKH